MQEQLEELHARHGTWRAVAEATGLGLARIQSWMAGKRTPRPEALARLEASLGGDRADLREQRIAEYARRVEATGGWEGEGYIFGPPGPAKPLDWLAGLTEHNP